MKTKFFYCLFLYLITIFLFIGCENHDSARLIEGDWEFISNLSSNSDVFLSKDTSGVVSIKLLDKKTMEISPGILSLIPSKFNNLPFSKNSESEYVIYSEKMYNEVINGNKRSYKELIRGLVLEDRIEFITFFFDSETDVLLGDRITLLLRSDVVD